MSKRATLFVFIFLLLVGCNANEDTHDWYETKQEAVQSGLEEESFGSEKAKLLSVEEFEGETIVFFERNRSLGVASIAESDDGFSWYRNRHFTRYEGDSAVMTGGFKYNTKSGQKVSIIAGKVNDPNITKLILRGDGNERKLQIAEESRMFFSIHETDFSSLDIIPISKSK